MLALQGQCLMVTTMHCSSRGKEPSATCCHHHYHVHLTNGLKPFLPHFWRHPLLLRAAAGVWVREWFANTLGLAAENRGLSGCKGFETWEVTEGGRAVLKLQLSDRLWMYLFLRSKVRRRLELFIAHQAQQRYKDKWCRQGQIREVP